MKKFKKICALFLSSVFTFSSFAKELVVKVEMESSNLDNTSKTYMSSAYNRFLQDILSVPEISVRTSSVDENLEAIQLKSQIEAATGMGSEEAAYATDKGSKAELSLLMKMSKLSQNSWQIVCELSEIETKKLVAAIVTDKLALLNVTSDESIDKLAYNTLLAIQKKSYINSIPASLISQLLHQENSSESYKKYLQDYTKQIEEIEKEKALLEQNAKTQEEKAEAERKALALQLKIDMLEKSKMQAEQALRRQSEAEANEAKKKKEIEELSREQQEQINKEIVELEKKRAELRAAVIEQMSLKKRIELIESDKSNFNQLNKLLDESVQKIQKEYDFVMNEKIKAKNNEPWAKGETDANGNPTEMAKKFRAQDVEEIKSIYQKQKENTVAELKKSMQANLDSYKNQIELNIAELQKTTYVFRSIDVTDDYLLLNVDEYDGNSYSWTVHSSFSVNDISKLDVSKLAYLPDATLTYETMTGKKPANYNSSKEEYHDYLDLVERADLYFRVSVPYLYSQLALKVVYDSTSDTYIAKPEYFRIYKMENNAKPLLELKASNFAQAEKKRLAELEAEKKKAQEEALAEEQRLIKDRKEKERQELEEANKRLEAAKKANFEKSQQSRLGIFGEVATVDYINYSDVYFSGQLLFGEKNYFIGLESDVLGYSDMEYVSLGLGCLGGVSVSIKNLRPYAGVSLGFMMMEHSDFGIGLSAGIFAGIEYNFGGYILGIEWKGKFVDGLGSFGMLALTCGIGL